MPSDQPISEDELHAYVDGDIEPARRLDIALYLARHPDEAIHALFDDSLHQPVPRRLRSIVRRHAARRARRRRGAGMLVGIAAAAVVLVTGRAVDQHAALDRDSPAASAAHQAPATRELPAIRPLEPPQQRNRNFAI